MNMKKNLGIWAIAALSMAACTSEDAPNIQQQVTENDWISPDGQVVVQLSAEGLPSLSTSVSRAPIEGHEINKLNDLGIFALARNGNYTITNTPTTPTVLLDNVWAKGQTSNTLDDQIHVDSVNAPLKRISLYDAKNAAKASIYYYPISATYNYDFYGYFPYSEEVTKTTNDVKVTFDLSKGDVDLITGAAEKAPQIKNDTLFVEVKDNQPVVGTSGNSWDGYNARYIRKIKYSNELVTSYPSVATTEDINLLRYVPNIKFGHRTTQLRFFVVANDKQSTADRDSTVNLRVDNITLLDMPVKPTWSLITDEISWGNTIQDIPMQEINKDIISLWQNDKIIPAASTDGNSAKQAGYLMVKPQDSYKLRLTVHAPVPSEGSAVPQEQDTEVTIQMKNKAGEVVAFEPGKYYNVYIQLNALQEINISAELANWEFGDNVYVPVGEE